MIKNFLGLLVVFFVISGTAATFMNSPAPTVPQDDIKDQIQASVDKVIKQVTVDPSAPPEFDPTSILSDYEGRVSELFKIDPKLRDRVSFWFDIYTKYPSETQVIHHREFPWVVFKVIDTAPILYADTPKFRWMRNQKAIDLVRHDMKAIRTDLKKISNISNIAKASLTEQQQKLVAALKLLPGNLQKNARFAAINVRMQTGQKDFFEQGLLISSQYLPEMDKIFAEHNVPSELTRIPLVESSFNHLATSRAGASGVWQFVGNTGRKFLIVNNNIDERRSPLKSTHAAARLLKENHLILYRQWPLAITAYNHGPGGVRKAAKAVRSTDITNLVSKYRSRSWGFASMNYFAEFMAALYAEKYKDEIFAFAGSPNMFTEDNIILPKAMRTTNLLRVTGLTQDEVLLYNPDLKQAFRRNTTLPRGYRLHVPSDRKDDLRAKFAVETPSKKKKTASTSDSTESRG